MHVARVCLSYGSLLLYFNFLVIGPRFHTFFDRFRYFILLSRILLTMNFFFQGKNTENRRFQWLIMNQYYWQKVACVFFGLDCCRKKKLTKNKASLFQKEIQAWSFDLSKSVAFKNNFFFFHKWWERVAVTVADFAS